MALLRHFAWLCLLGSVPFLTSCDVDRDTAREQLANMRVPYTESDFLKHVKKVVDRVGYCVVVASEGIRTADGTFVADAGGGKDAFGHTQLGGVASYLAGKVKDALGYKVHWTLPDYLQRSARHIASKTDLDQAMAAGKAAVQFALKARTRPCR